MAVSINRVLLAGNLTRDPVVRFFANERALADFGLALNRRWRTPEGEQKEEVTFVDVEAWGRTAELVGQYLTKGRPCFIEGRLRLDSWEDKDGNKRQKLKVVADSVHFIDSRPGTGSAAGSDSSPARTATAAEPTEASAASDGGAAPQEEPPF